MRNGGKAYKTHLSDAPVDEHDDDIDGIELATLLPSGGAASDFAADFANDANDANDDFASRADQLWRVRRLRAWSRKRPLATVVCAFVAVLLLGAFMRHGLGALGGGGGGSGGGNDGDPAILKSPNDARAYRLVALPNRLRALLISDPATERSAAALDVRVGSWSNPPGWDGLAHFCEHMLFLGTEKYPDEAAYNQYLSAHGGASNAFTASEDTNYFFHVDAKIDGAFKGALDRFSQFFLAPLFTAGSTAREMNAVDSEHKKNLQSDGWRFYQLLKHLSTQRPATAAGGHPFHRFSTGDLGTLNQPVAVPRNT